MGHPAFVAGMAKNNMLRPLESILRCGVSRSIYSPVILIALGMRKTLAQRVYNNVSVDYLRV